MDEAQKLININKELSRRKLLEAARPEMTANVTKSGCISEFKAARPETPLIGLYWINGDSLIKKTTTIDAPNTSEGGIRDITVCHRRFWETEVERTLPQFRGTDYTSLPRGRVMYYEKQKTFVVYGGDFIKNSRIRALIVNSFRLATQKVKFRWDEHYTKTIGDLPEWDDEEAIDLFDLLGVKLKPLED